MSYILDALRKADHDRERDSERGKVPSIHAQPAPATAAEAPAERNGQPLIWVVAGLSAVVLILLAWLIFGRSSGGDSNSGDATVAGSNANRLPPGAQPAPPFMQQPAQPSMQQQPLQQPMQQPVPAQGQSPAYAPTYAPAYTPTSPPPARPDFSRAGQQAMTPPPVAAAPVNVSQPAVTPTPSSTQSAGAGSKTDAQNHVLTMDELPDDVRRQWPNLSINGSKYSETPTSRILIVNGQVFHEGDRLTPDLTLEQIKVKEAVMRFRGYRVSMTF